MGEEETTEAPKAKVVRTTISMTEQEKEVASQLAEVLKDRGHIHNAKLSTCLRYCLYQVSYMMMKEIEGERYG